MRFLVHRADETGEPDGELLAVVEADTVMEAHDKAARILGEAWGPLTVTARREGVK